MLRGPESHPLQVPQSDCTLMQSRLADCSSNKTANSYGAIYTLLTKKKKKKAEKCWCCAEMFWIFVYFFNTFHLHLCAELMLILFRLQLFATAAAPLLWDRSVCVFKKGAGALKLLPLMMSSFSCLSPPQVPPSPLLSVLTSSPSTPGRRPRWSVRSACLDPRPRLVQLTHALT